MSTTHTPIPWKIDQGSYQRTNGRLSIVTDQEGVSRSSPVAEVPIYGHDGTATATAEFIVRCVNSHEALLEAAIAALNVVEHAEDGLPTPVGEEGNMLRIAIALAEGRQGSA